MDEAVILIPSPTQELIGNNQVRNAFWNAFLHSPRKESNTRGHGDNPRASIYDFFLEYV